MISGHCNLLTSKLSFLRIFGKISIRKTVLKPIQLLLGSLQPKKLKLQVSGYEIGVFIVSYLITAEDGGSMKLDASSDNDTFRRKKF